MGVPTSGNFSMFGSSDTSTIQGAVKQAGANSQINGANTFSQIISLSNVSLFNTTYSGNLSGSLSNVTNALQYRGYPALNSLTLCYDPTSYTDACNCDNGSGTYYVEAGSMTSAFALSSSNTLATNSNGSVAAAGWYSNAPERGSGSTQVYYWNGSNAWTGSNESVNSFDCPS